MSLISPDLSGIVDGSVGDAADWTTPMNVIINAFNGSIDDSNITALGTDLSLIGKKVTWSSWSPSYTASGSMTWTSVSTSVARYVQIGNIVIWNLDATGTTGGTADATLNFSLPVTAKASTGSPGSVFVRDPGTVGGYLFFTSTTVASAGRYDAANFGLGASRRVVASGMYEAA